MPESIVDMTILTETTWDGKRVFRVPFVKARLRAADRRREAPEG